MLPEGRVFTWDDMGHFRMDQNLLMHSLLYRTAVLREGGVPLPRHTFYVDNIYAYVPLPRCERIFYRDVDLYRYFIGREDQSVNEQVMTSRYDQQLRITRFMIDSVQLPDDVVEPKLRRYMLNYLSMMMCICSIFCRMIGTVEADEKRHAIWEYLKEHNPGAYGPVRRSVLNIGTNLPGSVGKHLGISGYHLAQKIFKFN